MKSINAKTESAPSVAQPANTASAHQRARPDSGQACARAIERRLSGLRERYRVSWFRNLDSTNDYALKLGDPAGLHGRLIVADAQSGGHGRFGRPWRDQPGKDLLFSLILLPPPPRALWHLLTLLCGAAICAALREHYALPAQMRWPNDVLLGERKVGGILTEARADRLVIGVGINVNSDPLLLPEELRETATSLKRERRGKSAARWSLLRRLLREFERRYQVFLDRDTAALAADFRRALGTLGRMVEARLHERTLRGTAIDLNEAGCLIIRATNGELHELRGGEVVELQQRPAPRDD